MNFKPIDGGFLVVDAEHGIEFLVDRLRWERDELIGQLTVSCGIAGARDIDGCLNVGTFNLSSPRARVERSKILAERSRTGNKLDWHERLEEVSQRVLKAERIGQPAVLLRTVPRPPADDTYEIDGLCLSKQHGTILFGDGGTCKSLFSLRAAGALGERDVRVGFFDWECDAFAHRVALERLFGPAMPDVHYVRCERPLVYEVDRLQRVVRDTALTYGVFDSVGYACAGPPEAAEHAMSYWRAVRQLRIGSLHIAHVRKENSGEKHDQRPFGSSFWHNSARATWFVKLVASAADEAALSLGLFNRKNNLGAVQPALGYDVQFGADRVAFTRVPVTTVAELAEGLPLWQRLKHAVTSGPRTLAALADELEAKVETLDRTVRRKSALFTRVQGTDGITRVALLERRIA